MCGICGELRFDGSHPDRLVLDRMIETLVRRGPDSGGFFTAGPVALGHRRLAIIDLSQRGHQPMLDGDRAIVFNGTIYNYRELRRGLQARGHQFLSDSDTEVILKAYDEWGEDCPAHLHGMFAFALWDGRQQSLFIARDRLGVKPLYYRADAQSFRMASTTQALLAAGGIDTRIDPVALHHHLTLHSVVPAPRTLLKGIHKLPPATWMRIGADGHLVSQVYWRLDATRPLEPRSDSEWAEALHDELRSAVQRRLRVADVPVGILLSGGLDSSLLVALLAESGASDIQTFSIGFEDTPEESGSEFEYSSVIAERYATRHHQDRISNAEVLLRLPEAVQVMAEPMVAQDAIGFFLLAERVSRHIKVVQSGQGADEILAGYFWYPRMALTFGTDLERFRTHYFDRTHEEFLETVTPAFYGDDHTSALIQERLAELGADTFLDRVLRMDTTMLMVDDPVKRVDNMTMAWGLEARLPYLDHHVVELTAHMPPALKVRGGGKQPLRTIARGLLPDSVIDRPKGYFPVPALKYIRGPLLAFMREILTSKTCRDRHLFQTTYLERLLNAPEQNMTPLRGAKLWHAALLELWLQLNVDSPPRPHREPFFLATPDDLTTASTRQRSSA
ncbi:MAG: N-acetylglutaminylglutamine amidotransferase [Gammaproteobacteria bacterium]